MSRTIFVYEDEGRDRDLIPDKDEKYDDDLRKALIHDLRLIASDQVRIPIYLHPDVKKKLNEQWRVWKKARREALTAADEAFYARIHTQMLKILAIVTVSRDGTQVEMQDYERAEQYLIQIREGLKKISMLLGADQNIQIKHQIRDMIQKSGVIPVKQVHELMLNEAKLTEINEIINQMIVAGLISTNGTVLTWKGGE